MPSFNDYPFIFIGFGSFITGVALLLLRKGPTDIDEQVKGVQGFYNIFRGVIPSWILRKRSESRTKLAEQQNKEIAMATELAAATHTSRIAMETARHDLVETPGRLERETLILEATDQHTLGLIREAERLNISLLGLEGMMLAREANSESIRMKEAEARIRVYENQAMKDIEVRAELQQILNTLDAILRYKNIKYAEFDLLRERLRDLILERNEAMERGASFDELELINKALSTYLRLFNEQVKRFTLEAGNGENPETVNDADALYGRVQGLLDEPAKERPPLKKSRRRQRG